MGSTDSALVSMDEYEAEFAVLCVKVSGSMEAERALAAASELNALLTMVGSADDWRPLLRVGSSYVGGKGGWREVRASDAMKNRMKVKYKEWSVRVSAVIINETEGRSLAPWATCTYTFISPDENISIIPLYVRW